MNGHINEGFDSSNEAVDTKDNKDVENQDEQQRAKWGNGIEFLLSCVAMSVGLGNIWRFPFTAYENGGGAFLIPYIIILLLVGRPVYYLDMCLGQFTGRGNVQTFELLGPAFKGIGYAQLFGTICVATYYCSLMALTLFYLVNSFTSDLPWSECRDEWNNSVHLVNATCVPSKEVLANIDQNNTISSSELYFNVEVLKMKTYIDDGIGWPEWRLTICLFLSWAATFIVSMRGVQSSGKASYFLAIFPYVIMFTLLIRAVTLEGSSKGILYFFEPNWEKLTDAKVWYAAVTQCFFSINIGFGSITMYASYNDFRHNIYRDALIVTSLDTLTSILAGATIFGILGNLAYKLDVEIEDVINAGGPGLAFISYPEAIAKFDAVPWLFAILFFVMLFVLGVGSLVALQGCTFTVIMDNFPSLKAWHVSLGTAIGGFIIGLVYITPGGQFILTLIDYFGATFIFFILTTLEVVIVFWYYGTKNFCWDIEFMLKRKVGMYWRISWTIVTPTILIFIFFYFLINLERLKHDKYDFPDIAIVVGWILFAVGILQPLFWYVWYYIEHRDKSIKEVLCASFTPTDWGPKNKEDFDEWKMFKIQKEKELDASNKSWLQKKINILLDM